jgi:hypothetical protein
MIYNTLFTKTNFNNIPCKEVFQYHSRHNLLPTKTQNQLIHKNSYSAKKKKKKKINNSQILKKKEEDWIRSDPD